jgi:hypothetical protein
MTSQPITGDDLICEVDGVRVAVAGLPPACRRRVAAILRPFVLEPRQGAVAPDSARPAAAPTFSNRPLRLQVTRRGPADWLVEGDGADPTPFGSFVRVVSHLEWRVVSDALAQSVTSIPLHAGALTHGDAVVLLVAPSESGKTTLTLGLMGRGWEPFGDDITLLDPATLRVRAFPRHFHIMPASLALFTPEPALERDPTVWGYARPLRWAAGARAPTAIFLLAREPARPSTLEPIPRAELAATLLRESVRTRLPLGALAGASAILAASVAVSGRLNNGDLATALDLIEHAALG